MANKAHGFKALAVDSGGILHSPSAGFSDFLPNVDVVAACPRNSGWSSLFSGASPHPSPDQNCTCGVRAWNTPADIPTANVEDGGQVIAVVEAAGRMFPVPGGVRAERVRVVGIVTETVARIDPKSADLVRQRYADVEWISSLSAAQQRYGQFS